MKGDPRITQFLPTWFWYNISSTLAVAGKFKKWSKYLGSVLKRCVYDVRSSKKNLGSIGGSLEEPQPKHVHWGLALDLCV